ncbi:hypothetical protein [Peribacillus sp. TH24]|uniref:hypothetical protein n=1 Tax=Peribacillus sp. TH24 TaxID=2798483 RepID=UPI001913BE73|nr:hypothetical protein [Peribacillus sp. TH24]MBK5443251.1 hypothetical protein [Peribacillus sp. TH24]
MTKWIKKRPGWIISAGIFIVIQMAAITVQEAYVFADFLWGPFSAITNWELPEASSPYFKIVSLLRFDVIMILYTLLIGAFIIVLMKILGSKKLPPYPFEEELAAALEAVYDTSLPSSTIDREVKKLFDQIRKQISSFTGIRGDKIRAVVVYQKPGMSNPVFSKMTWGPQITQQQIDWDDLALKILQQGGRSHVLWPSAKESIPNGDAESYLLVRNIGEYRLGILFAFKVSVNLTEDELDKLKVEVAPITLLGHIDKILDIVVKYP